jgi:hypothetical protein
MSHLTLDRNINEVGIYAANFITANNFDLIHIDTDLRGNTPNELFNYFICRIDHAKFYTTLFNIIKSDSEENKKGIPLQDTL